MLVGLDGWDLPLQDPHWRDVVMVVVVVLVVMLKRMRRHDEDDAGGHESTDGCSVVQYW